MVAENIRSVLKYSLSGIQRERNALKGNYVFTIGTKVTEAKNSSRSFGGGVSIRGTISRRVKKFETSSCKVYYIGLKWKQKVMITTNEEKEDDIKVPFYKRLELIDVLPKHDIKVVIGDINWKVSSKQIYREVAEEESRHDKNSDDGIRLEILAMDRKTPVLISP